MTVTFSQEHIYIGIIVLLMGIQIYQQSLIKKLEKESEDIWTQMGTLVSNITSQLMSLQRDINSKEDKK